MLAARCMCSRSGEPLGVCVVGQVLAARCMCSRSDVSH